MAPASQSPQADGIFGTHGGRYVPKELEASLNELSAAYSKYKDDPDFQQEFRHYLTTYAGRETPLFFCKNLTAQCNILRTIRVKGDRIGTPLLGQQTPLHGAQAQIPLAHRLEIGTRHGLVQADHHFAFLHHLTLAHQHLLDDATCQVLHRRLLVTAL